MREHRSEAQERSAMNIIRRRPTKAADG